MTTVATLEIPPILVIDDIREFAFDAVYARTSAEALELIPTRDWIELWLDFDLGEETGEIDTVIPVINWLEEEAYNGRLYAEFVTIHTSNPVGRKRIRAALEKYYPIKNIYLDIESFAQGLSEN